jgi:hypothetical protein
MTDPRERLSARSALFVSSAVGMCAMPFARQLVLNYAKRLSLSFFKFPVTYCDLALIFFQAKLRTISMLSASLYIEALLACVTLLVIGNVSLRFIAFHF